MANHNHSYNSGRINRAGTTQKGNTAAGRSSAPPPRRPAPKRKKRWPKVVISLGIVLAVGIGAVIVLLNYLDGVFEPGKFGFLSEKKYVPKEYTKKQVVHILIVGIDYEEGRYSNDGLGLTDMILYAQYDIVNNQLNLLQIPRDTYVGDQVNTGWSGKINALLMHGPDQDNPINNLADEIEKQFKLPVDHYIAMDMEALKTIVNTFGGLKVYVPRDMYHAGSYLEQGWRWLDGDAAEFFVRNRYGEGFERADIDRLDNQRHFYSALFRRFLNLKPQDIPKLLPVFEYYCNTDFSLTDIMDLALSALKLKGENVLFCKAPGATGDELDPSGGENRGLYFIDLYGRGDEENPGLATLLNEYFRAYGEPVYAEQLGLPQIHIPDSYTLYPPNIQVMSSVEESEGGADINVEPDAA